MLLSEDGTPATPEDVLIRIEALATVEDALATLSEREEYVIRKRFGFDDAALLTLRQIGKMLGVSDGRVGQNSAKAMRKLECRGPRRWELLEAADTLGVLCCWDIFRPAPRPEVFVACVPPPPPPPARETRAAWIALLEQTADEVRGTRYDSLLAGLERDIATIRDWPPSEPFPWRLDVTLFHATSRQLREQIDKGEA
jgi:hypothetical protein